MRRVAMPACCTPVAAPGAMVLRVLELVDLRRTVPVDESVEAAVTALTPPAWA